MARSVDPKHVTLVVFNVRPSRGLAYLNVVESGKLLNPAIHCAQWASLKATAGKLREAGWVLDPVVPDRAVFRYWKNIGYHFKWNPKGQ